MQCKRNEKHEKWNEFLDQDNQETTWEVYSKSNERAFIVFYHPYLFILFSYVGNISYVSVCFFHKYSLTKNC